jgi:hypothetical protein
MFRYIRYNGGQPHLCQDPPWEDGLLYICYNGGQPHLCQDPPWEDGPLYPLQWWPASPLLGSSLGRWSAISATMMASLTFARILLGKMVRYIRYNGGQPHLC